MSDVKAEAEYWEKLQCYYLEKSLQIWLQNLYIEMDFSHQRSISKKREFRADHINARDITERFEKLLIVTIFG